MAIEGRYSVRLSSSQKRQVLKIAREEGCLDCSSTDFVVSGEAIQLWGPEGRITVPISCNECGTGLLLPVVEKDGVLVQAPVEEH